MREYNGFADLIKIARKGRNMTQIQLGDKMGVSGAYIAKIEKGGQCPSAQFLEKLSDILEIELAELFFSSQLECRHPERLREMIRRFHATHVLLKNNIPLARLMGKLQDMDPSVRNRCLELMNGIADLACRDKVLD
ncbi:helix-turn-helix transcriptional regulator [bacterium]|nr:helix-turn-helix transcriptional regulator [candidate division CSSED10-310 bacterium]